MVGLEDKLLDHDEIAALCRVPKFCVRRLLDEERFLMECEKSCFKLRIDMYDNNIVEDDPGGGVKESEKDRIERERVEKLAELAELEGKTVFNEDEMSLDYGKKKAPDCKHNTCVKLPRPKSAKVEQEIDYRRMAWKKL